MARNRTNRELEDEDKKVKFNKENWKEALTLLKFIKPYHQYFATDLLFIVLSSFTTLSFPI